MSLTRQRCSELYWELRHWRLSFQAGSVIWLGCWLRQLLLDCCCQDGLVHRLHQLILLIVRLKNPFGQHRIHLNSAETVLSQSLMGGLHTVPIVG